MSKLTGKYFKRSGKGSKVIQDSIDNPQTRQFFERSATPEGGVLRPPGMSLETWRRLVAETVESEPQPDPDDTPAEPMPAISIVTHTGLEPLAEVLTLTPLEGLSDSELGALQDKVEGVGGENWTPELSKLHFDIVHEWERRERIDAIIDNPPPDA